MEARKNWKDLVLNNIPYAIFSFKHFEKNEKSKEIDRLLDMKGLENNVEIVLLSLLESMRTETFRVSIDSKKYYRISSRYAIQTQRTP